MRRQLPILATIIASLLLASPTRAADPTPTPMPATEPGPEGPTIHAEMLAEHAGDEATLAPGGVPAAIDADADLRVAATGDYPNGLHSEVLGYLPYWTLGTPQMASLDYGLLSTIAYFSVGATSTGTLDRTNSLGNPTVGWAGWTSAAMTDVIAAAHARGVKVVLTVTMMSWGGDDTAMRGLLTRASNRQRLAGEIAAAVKLRNADGVNLDFEPVPASLASYYTALVHEVKAALGAAGAGRYLTVATTGGAASWATGYELIDGNGDGRSLTSAGGADALMVMGYDFSWAGSTRAGGVAPIDNPYILDIREAMTDYLEVVSADRLIWGMPYYGRAWTTQNGNLNALTCKNATICPDADPDSSPFGRSWAPRYVDALDAIAVHGRLWDAAGRVPWYRYQSSTYGTWVEAYYDDATSLTAKYDLVLASRMKGIGIWHLLMDGSRRELWGAIDRSFQGPWFDDIVGNPFRYDIVWLAESGITAGCGGERFCPKLAVTREQMASFLARALDLPAPTRDWFRDDEASGHEADINRLADAGITGGCAPGRFCPSAVVTREQMASFLARALELPATTTDPFGDDEASAHEADINRLAAAGITGGCATGRFCPTIAVLREQMAAFLHRAFE